MGMLSAEMSSSLHGQRRERERDRKSERERKRERYIESKRDDDISADNMPIFSPAARLAAPVYKLVRLLSI